jgi:NADH:ubiquinone oxidoreductase 24 kD subunit
MKVTICIGSSCHLKGSRQIVEQMQSLIANNKLQDKVELAGTFCMGNCTEGVCVMVDEQTFSLRPENTASFFETEVMGRL